MPKILIIEDNFEVRDNLQEILELSAYEVVAAENGKIGVQQALSCDPDLILCDVMMPELDGFAVLRILERKAQTASIPFIFLTAKAEKSDLRKGMNLGADDYITKPFDDVELLDAIEMRLKKSQKLKTVFDKTETGFSAFINEAKGQEALSALPENRTIKSYRKKDFIFDEGAFAKQLFFIKKGKIKLFKTNEDGKEYIIDILGEGDFLGYLPLLQASRYSESAVAMENVDLSIIPKEDFMQLLYANRDVANQFIKILADNVTENEERLLQLAYDSVRKRVAEALLLLYDKLEKSEDNESFSILRDDLANMVGTAKESVIRTLTDLKKEGFIDIKNGKIAILDFSKLVNLPN